MSYVYDQIRQQALAGAQPQCWAALIAETASAPDEKVPVTIAAFHPDFQWGPCRWQPRVQSVVVNVAESPEAAHNVTVAQVVMPTRGDPCLVCFDETDEPWILTWWPAGFDG